LPATDFDRTPGHEPGGGYCIHGSISSLCPLLITVVTFPTWHRPYLALYEQCLASYFPVIADKYNRLDADPQVGQALEAAAQVWRLPYWDWALFPAVPTEIASPTVNIISAQGTLVSVRNPLHHYGFQNMPEPSFTGFNRPNYAGWPTTLRQPNSPLSRNAVSQPDVVNEMIASDDELMTKVLDLFPTTLPTPDPWGQFSNHSWASIPGHQGHITSLEEIHDRIHGYIGGPGHMGNTGFSAFDPIFWFHHANIDRLCALWQAVYPGVYVSPGPNFGTSFPVRSDSSQRWDDHKRHASDAVLENSNQPCHFCRLHSHEYLWIYIS
jgi:tyrosinase